MYAVVNSVSAIATLAKREVSKPRYGGTKYAQKTRISSGTLRKISI